MRTVGLAIAATWAFCGLAASLSAHLLLNVLWWLLAIAAARYLRRSEQHCRPAPVLLSLICVLVLLFPIVSANDDAARWDLANDASTSQVVIKSLDDGKQTPVQGTGERRLPHRFLLHPPVAQKLEAVPTYVSPQLHLAYLGASGIHSPPSC